MRKEHQLLQGKLHWFPGQFLRPMVELKANRALQINLCGLHKELEALHCPSQNKTLSNNFRTDQLVIQMPHTCHTCRRSLPKLLQRHIFVSLLLHDLSNCHLKILLGNMHSPLTQCKHACFCANSLYATTNTNLELDKVACHTNIGLCTRWTSEARSLC